MHLKITKILDWLTTKKVHVKPMGLARPRRKSIKAKPKIEKWPSDETPRERHPAVKDAWEQYQMLIKLNGGLREDERKPRIPDMRGVSKYCG